MLQFTKQELLYPFLLITLWMYTISTIEIIKMKNCTMSKNKHSTATTGIKM